MRGGPTDDTANRIPGEVSMSRGLVPSRRPWVALAVLAMVFAAPPSAPAQTEYTSQNSATTNIHSGIVTSRGVVWDTDFATMVTRAIGAANYNEIAFAFMECFGGGMIDELRAANLSPAAYTAAAMSNGMNNQVGANNQPSWAFPPGLVTTPQTLPLSQSTYNLAWAPVAGGAVNFTMQQAAVVGRNNDATGPVLQTGVRLFPNGFIPPPFNRRYPVLENPQYTSSGPRGDGITLHQVNPAGGVQNTRYLAVLFGGSTNDVSNRNSLNTMVTALNQRGYDTGRNSNEVRTIQPGGTAADLRAAWNWVGQNTTPTTQIFYWNSWGHGTLGQDVRGTIRQLVGNFMPTSGTTYTFGMGSDTVSDMVAHAGYARSIGDTDPLDSPYFEIQTQQPISNLSVTLNGHSLTSLGLLDLFGDGSLYDYDFALGPGDLQLIGALDSVALNWTGPADPGFGAWMLNDGNLGNFGPDAFVPAPASWVMLLLGVGPVGVAWLSWRRRGPGVVSPTPAPFVEGSVNLA
jgi:hypothetical protein